MSATDELQKLLDERMVEWTYKDGTVRYESDGHWHLAWAYNDDKMVVSMGYLTPEQAIAATLGAGTCRWEYPQGVNGWLGYAVCSACGERFDECVTDVAHYCPNCGRKVVDE